MFTPCLLYDQPFLFFELQAILRHVNRMASKCHWAVQSPRHLSGRNVRMVYKARLSWFAGDVVSKVSSRGSAWFHFYRLHVVISRHPLRCVIELYALYACISVCLRAKNIHNNNCSNLSLYPWPLNNWLIKIKVLPSSIPTAVQEV